MKTIHSLWQWVKDSSFSRDVALFSLSICIYILALTLPIPSQLGLFFRYEGLNIMVPVVGITFLAYRIRQSWNWFIGLSTVFAIFGAALAGIWSTGISNAFMVAGFLPQTDAVGYLGIARNLLDGTDVYLNSLRPFGPFLIASFLLFTQQNLQVAIALIVSFVALSCFLVSWEVRRTHGPWPGAIVFTGLFIYYRSSLGTLMTEGLGLAIGCLGFALLWRSGVRRHQTLALIGFGLMAFAMLVRTGAVFILPLLLLWGAFVFARRSRWISVPFLAIGTIITLGASFYNSVISRYVSEGEYISFGNYSYVLYGILKGGSWLLIFQDHPEITGDPNLPLSDKYDLIYQMCFEIIQNDPMALVRGVFRAWTMLFSHGVPAHFTESLFFGIATPSLIWTMKWVFYPLMGLGLLGCLWFWRHPLHSLILAMVVGIFLSSALAPIWDTGLRAYAATMPTGYILMALGFWFLIQGLLWLNNWFRISRWLTIPLQDFVWPIESSPLLSFQKEVQEKNKDFPFHLTIWSSILLVFLSAVLPVLIKAITPRSQYLAASCPAGQEARVVYYHPHAIVNLVPDDQISVSKIPNLKISDFYEGLSIFKRLKNPIGDTLSVLQPGQTIIYIQGFDNIVAPTSMVPEKPGHYTICGQKVFTSQAEPRMKFVFTVFASYSFHPIQQTDKPLETSVVLPAGLKAI